MTETINIADMAYAFMQFVSVHPFSSHEVKTGVTKENLILTLFSGSTLFWHTKPLDFLPRLSTMAMHETILANITTKLIMMRTTLSVSFRSELSPWRYRFFGFLVRTVLTDLFGGNENRCQVL